MIPKFRSCELSHPIFVLKLSDTHISPSSSCFSRLSKLELFLGVVTLSLVDLTFPVVNPLPPLDRKYCEPLTCFDRIGPHITLRLVPATLCWGRNDLRKETTY